MKSSSEHLSNFIICFSSMSFCSSSSTLSSNWSGTGRPFCCDVVYCDLNIDFAIWFLERPSLVHKCGYLWNIHFIMFFSVWIWEITLSFLPGFLFALRVMPSFLSISLPMMLFVRFFTINTLRVFAVHDPDFMSSVSTPFISMLFF